ncbi:recombinase family protein [Ruminococcus sp.]|uniref:recombinase family protein n=1 Tax=Ruminococcus sp. TaxID=41978 RepID=UPI0026256B41|nr:recombinase family protein [Ruminococcus sp.]
MIIAQIKDVFKSAQVSLLYKLAPQIPGHVVDIYMDFHSGADDDRRGLHRLHEDCRSGKIDTVYTKSVSRMARNTVDLLNILRELRAINVRIIFELESLDTANYETEFLITIIEAYAQEESYHRSENTRWGLEKRIKDGTSGLYRRKCFGYTKSEDGALVICPKEAVVVRLIYDLYMEGNSILSITRILEEKGIPTPTGKEKWSNQAIVKILTNEKYVGNVLLGKSYTEEFPRKKRHENKGDRKAYLAEDTHPAIIAMEQFLAVQEERKRRSNMVLDEFGEYHRAAQRYSMCKKQTGDLSMQQGDSGENDE